MSIAESTIIYIADCAATLLAVWYRGTVRDGMVMNKVRNVISDEDVENTLAQINYNLTEHLSPTTAKLLKILLIF